MFLRRTSSAAGLLLALSCARADQPSNEPAVPLSPTLALDLPMGDADSVLVAELQDATRLSDGRIALLDAGRKVVVLVASDGSTLGAFGGQGAGPGEYRFPEALGRCAADSLFVWDMGRSKATILGPEGRTAREVRPAVPTAYQFSCLPDGRFVAMDASKSVGAPRASNGKAALIHGALVIMSPEGDSLAAVPDLVLGEAKVVGQLAGMAVLNDRVVIGLNGSNELVSYEFDGTRIGAVRVAVTAVPLSDRRFEAMVDKPVADMGGDSTVRARLRQMILAEGKPELAPLFSSMHGSPDGTVWWVTSLPGDSTTTLLGFRGDAPARSLQLPAGTEVFEVGSDYLLAKRTDEEGFERLVMWRW